MKHFRKSKYFIICIAATAVLTVGIGTTFAMLKVQATEVTNLFDAAKINVQIVEELPGGSSTQGSDQDHTVDFGKVIKGKPITKKVCIENKHSEEYPTTDTFVRCRIVPILRDSEGNNIAANVKIKINSNDMPGNGWTIGYDESETERYYYWKSVLPRGEKTGNLIDQVTVMSDIPNGAHLELQILVDAVQARPYPPTGFDLLPAAEREEAGKKIPSYQAWKWYYDGTELTNKFYE